VNDAEAVIQPYPVELAREAIIESQERTIIALRKKIGEMREENMAVAQKAKAVEEEYGRNIRALNELAIKTGKRKQIKLKRALRGVIVGLLAEMLDAVDR
jgi:hypothetical protein